MSGALRRASWWTLCGAGVAAVAGALAALSMPSPVLLAGVLVGGFLALRERAPSPPPPAARRLAQAIIGATAAVGVSPASVAAVLGHWAPVLLVSAATLLLSVALGLAVGRLTRLDATTSSLGMIAGGASGVVSMAGELGADDRIVAVMQYLRVTLSIALTPVIAVQLFHAGSAPAGAGGAVDGGLAAATLFVGFCAAAGLLAARRVPIPGGELLWPLLIAVVLSLTTGWGASVVPAGLTSAALAVIGLHVGVRLRPTVLRRIGAILPATVASILLLMGLSVLLGVALSALAHVSLLDGYLATTPGGLPVVVAVAVATKSDTTFVMAVQVLRMVLMLLAAAPLARWMRARAADPVACAAH